jgi:transcriptional regulator with XRE-family HTH domain
VVSKTFAVRLNRLFETVYPPSRGPHTSAELVAALEAQGIHTSVSEITLLRAGGGRYPSEAMIAGTAAFFRVSPAYFTDEWYFDSMSRGPLRAVNRVHSLPFREKKRLVSDTFTTRLARLFDSVYPPGRGPHTSAELLTALDAQGIHISAPYLSQLRRGTRANPSEAMIEGIAAFFRVSPAYFTDEWYFRMIDKELAVFAAMRDNDVRRVADRVAGLSAAAVDQVAARVEELRRAENLD